MEIKINLITPPDKVNTEGFDLLLIYPSNELLKELQDRFLTTVDQDVNLYLYKQEAEELEIDWLFDVSKFADTIIIDIDSTPYPVRDLVSYFLASSKTYWLTNAHNPIYNNINKNRIINLETLANIGGNFV